MKKSDQKAIINAKYPSKASFATHCKNAPQDELCKSEAGKEVLKDVYNRADSGGFLGIAVLVGILLGGGTYIGSWIYTLMYTDTSALFLPIMAFVSVAIAIGVPIALMRIK